ncbi:MAG: cyclic nucleotide-binding domain-containing protein, partial [Akkermansiaceae bacterium]|nr:cyclic nucleotide-binding domain-containing protein [Akkermansiaceae bacterium]
MEALRGMVLVKDSATLASEIARRARIERSPAGRVLIEEGGSDSEIYFILEGRLQVMVRGREYALLGPGAHVGEFSLID